MIDMKFPPMTKLNISELLDAASRLSRNGTLVKSKNNLIYLNIDDNYIHRLFPFLQDKQIIIPDYFGKQKSGGAHISVIYPDERVEINNEELDKDHHFIVKDLVAADLGQKIYYILLVEARSLLKLRKKYHLPDLLSFKGYSIPFHITIGVKLKNYS